MTMTGWIKLYRAVQRHWLWNDKPFAKGQAWVDLILLANHEDVKVLQGNRPQTFSRGEAAVATRELASRWGWSKHKVMDFLAALETDGMIRTAKGPQGTIIKLSNYDAFQGSDEGEGTAEGPQKDRRRTTPGPLRDHNKNEKNIKNDKNEKEIRSASARYSFPLKDGTEYGLADEDVAEWEQLYPGLDIAAELRAIKAWCIANPEKRKTRSGAKRFLNGWFARSQRDKKPQEQVTSFMDLWREAQ